MPDTPERILYPWQVAERREIHEARGRANAHRPLPAVLAQLRNRVAAGEDAEALLTELHVFQGALRRKYLERLIDA